jgi:hypothetical protein
MKTYKQIGKKIDKLDFLNKTSREESTKTVLRAQIDVLKWARD